MKRMLLIVAVFLLFAVSMLGAQTNEWGTQYVTLDDAVNGTGTRTSSVAVVGQDDFVALISDPSVSATTVEGLFENMSNNFLVGYMDADSASGRVAFQAYNPVAQIEVWQSGLDQVSLNGAWQIAGGTDNMVYVANNDENHNILVFQLMPSEVASTDFRMETGIEYIYGIEVDAEGYVYVADFIGDDTKTDEIKVFAPIGAEGTTWGDPSGHTDAPITTLDLPPGRYQGLAVSGNGTQLWVSATSERSVWKFAGDPVNGYTADAGFNYTLAPEDTVSGGSGTTQPLGLSYSDAFDLVFAAVDTFIFGGGSGGYPYGRIYVLDGTTGANQDTIDIAEWNLAQTGDYSSGSGNGRAGGFTSVVDVDFDPVDNAVYTQTYFGWAVEKWLFDGDLGSITTVEQIVSTVPEGYVLKQNYPNPFNPTTTIEFDVKTAEHVTLTLYNLLGQQVEVLVNGPLSPGTYKTTLNAADLTSGVYYYSLEAGSFKAVRKLVLTK